MVLAGKRKGPGSGCVYVPERIANRPDPCIYSQFLLMNLGQPVTWDNPDVVLRRGGVEQYTYDLSPATQYDVEVIVHNASRRKPAAGTEVRLGWIEFGAGAEIRHPIGSVFVDVGVWPATAVATFTWTTPASPGHYCLEVDLIHADDGNPSNNRGWNNTIVKEAHSRVETPVRIFNRWPRGCPDVEEGGTDVVESPLVVGFAYFGALLGGAGAQLHTVTATENHRHAVAVDMLGGWMIAGLVAGVAIGVMRNLIGAWWRRRKRRAPHVRAAAERRDRERVPCEAVEVTVDSYAFADATGKSADPKTMFAPRPPAWPAHVEPASFHFQPGEEHRDVMLVVDAPDGPGPAEVFNVSVRQGGAPTGGVTVTVQRGA